MTNERDIDVDDLLRRVRSEVERRQRAQSGDMPSFDVSVPRVHGRPVRPAPRGDWTYADLLGLEDEDFVDAAYVAAVGRTPDQTGRAHFLAALRSGALSKAEIVGRLRFSPEGRMKRRRIRGLFAPFAWRTLCRVPILGYVLSLANYGLRLPTLVRNIEAYENHSRLRLRTIEGDLSEHARVMEETLGRVRDALREVARTSSWRAVADKVATLSRALDTVRLEGQGLLQRIDSTAGDAEALRAEVEATRRRLEELARDTRGGADALSAELVAIRERLEDTRAALDAGASTLESQSARVDDVSARLAQQALGKADTAALARVEERVRQLASSQIDRAALGAQLEAINERVATRAGTAELGAVRDRLVELGEAKADRIALELLRTQLDGRLAGLADAEAMRNALARLERFIDDVRLATRAMRAPVAPEADDPSDPAGAVVPYMDMDAFYVELETEFRGTSEQTKLRAEPFVAVVAAAQAGTHSAPLLDLGCGRGEWLELLRERGFSARGVDLNPLFVEAARERGLDVTQEDAISALRALPDQSLGAITALHVAEHLALEVLVELLDESRRVLKPGGVLVLETPNPENLAIGACNFYLDPTHRQPIPPALLEFLVRSRGFPRTEIRRLHEHRIEDPFGPMPDEISRVPELSLVIALVKQAYYSAPDYAVIAHTG